MSLKTKGASKDCEAGGTCDSIRIPDCLRPTPDQSFALVLPGNLADGDTQPVPVGEGVTLSWIKFGRVGTYNTPSLLPGAENVYDFNTNWFTAPVSGKYNFQTGVSGFYEVFPTVLSLLANVTNRAIIRLEASRDDFENFQALETQAFSLQGFSIAPSTQFIRIWSGATLCTDVLLSRGTQVRLQAYNLAFASGTVFNVSPSVDELVDDGVASRYSGRLLTTSTIREGKEQASVNTKKSVKPPVDVLTHRPDKKEFKRIRHKLSKRHQRVIEQLQAELRGATSVTAVDKEKSFSSSVAPKETKGAPEAPSVTGEKANTVGADIDKSQDETIQMLQLFVLRSNPSLKLKSRSKKPLTPASG